MSIHSAQLAVFGSLVVAPSSGDADFWAIVKKIGQYSLNFADGDGIGLLNQHLFKVNSSLSASGTDSIFTNDGTQKDASGVIMTMSKLRLLVVANTSTDPSCILALGSQLGFNICSDVTKTINILPGGLLVLAGPSAAGYSAVGSSTGKFTINNPGSAAASYDFYAGGS